MHSGKSGSNPQTTHDELPVIQEKDLRREKLLGTGNNGEVFRCEYTGDDEAIRSLCVSVSDQNGAPHYWCAIKISKRGQEKKLADEQRVIDHLRKNWMLKHPGEPAEHCPYCLGMGVKRDDGTSIVVLRLECYAIENNQMQSSDVLHFLREMSEELAQPQALSPPVQALRSAFNDLTTRVQLLGSLYRGISVMHQPVIDESGKIVRAACMHNDIATRNALMGKFTHDSGFTIGASAKPTDYGLAVILDEYYCAEHTDDPEAAPIMWMSRVRLEKKPGTYRTPLDDLYAHRVMMLESLCIKMRPYLAPDDRMGDKDIIDEHIRVMNAMIETLPFGEDKERSILFLSVFSDYLKNVQAVDFKPLSAYGGDEIKQKEAIRDEVQTKLLQDRKMLEDAHEKFFIKQLAYHLFNYQINDKNTFRTQQMHVEIKRLLSDSIIVSDKFKRSDLYQCCLKISDRQINAIGEIEASKLINEISVKNELKIPLMEAKESFMKNIKEALDMFGQLQKIIAKTPGYIMPNVTDYDEFKHAAKLINYLHDKCAVLQQKFPNEELTKNVSVEFGMPEASKKALGKLFEDAFVNILACHLFRYKESEKGCFDVNSLFNCMRNQRVIVGGLDNVSDSFKNNELYRLYIEGDKLKFDPHDLSNPDELRISNQQKEITEMLLNNEKIKPILALIQQRRDAKESPACAKFSNLLGFAHASQKTNQSNILYLLKDCFNVKGKKGSWLDILNASFHVVPSDNVKAPLTKVDSIKVLGLEISKQLRHKQINPDNLLSLIIDVINASTKKGIGKSKVAVNLVKFLEQNRNQFDSNKFSAAIENITSKEHRGALVRATGSPFKLSQD